MAEDNKEKQNITIHIYDTMIPITIPRDEEENWRKAGSLVNQRLNAYFSHYKGLKSEKEMMYYTMIDLAMRSQRNDASPYNDILDKLSKEIDDALK